MLFSVLHRFGAPAICPLPFTLPAFRYPPCFAYIPPTRVTVVFVFLQVFLVDNSIHSIVACANYYGLFSLDEIEVESQVSVFLWLLLHIEDVGKSLAPADGGATRSEEACYTRLTCIATVRRLHSQTWRNHERIFSRLNIPL